MRSLLIWVAHAQMVGANRVSREESAIQTETGCPARVGGIDASGSYSIHECKFDDASTNSYTESGRIMGLLSADEGVKSTCAYECGHGGHEGVVCYSQWLGPGNFVWKCGTGEDLPEDDRRSADDIVLRDIPASRDELPGCPCTIYSGFCDRTDLKKPGQDWGVACVAAEDAFVTMHWMVQCVPIRAGGLAYHCPAHLPLMCDAERTQEPCDTSALGHCDADTCTGGHMMKEELELPLFCQLGSCTQTECCDRCPAGATSQGSSCTGPSGQNLPDSCCEEPETVEIVDEISCPDQILALAEPTAMRMQAYTQTCLFSPADVDVSSPNFALTSAGRAKLCEAPCQAAAVLADSPLDVWADARSLATTCGDDPALTSQISPVGFFSAASEMDRRWKECSSGSAPQADDSHGFYNKDTPR